MSDSQDLTASELLRVRCPRKWAVAWRFARRQCVWECSWDQHPGAEKEAGLGRRRSWGAMQSQQRLHSTPWGALGQGWPCTVFQNWDVGHGPLYYASCPWKRAVTLGEAALFRRRQFLGSCCWHHSLELGD